MRNRITGETAVQYRVIVVLVGVVYGTLHHYNKDLISADLNAALTVTLLLLLVEQFFEIGHRLEIANRSSREREEVESAASKDRGILGQLLKDIHHEILHAITLKHDGYKLSQPFLAIYSYSKFWTLLTELQQQRKNNGQPALTVEAIHSSTMDVWIGTHPLSARLLEIQKEFCDEGGKITRVLCRPGPPDEKVVLAQRKMVEAHIEVRYYDIRREQVDHHFGWDYLRVPELRICVIWDSFARTAGHVMRDAVYVNSETYDGKDLTRLWSEIRKHSVPLPESAYAVEQAK